jgi:hypothetical protein
MAYVDPNIQDILFSIREMLIQHLANSQPLTANLSAGSTTVKLPNTSRFRPKDEVFLMSDAENLTEQAQIDDIVAWDTVSLKTPTTRPWLLSKGARMLKAIGFQPLKRVQLGDLLVNPSFPCITIEPKSEENEWMTIRGTSHEHTVQIKLYVLNDNFESTNVLLAKYASQAREILMDHIHPIVNGVAYPLATDLPAGSTVVTVPSTAGFKVAQAVYLRDANVRPSDQEAMVRTILSPQQIELSTSTEHDYLVARQAEIIRSDRYLYDTRASRITYGFVPGSGGSVMKGAEFTWFAKELIFREGNLIT